MKEWRLKYNKEMDKVYYHSQRTCWQHNNSLIQAKIVCPTKTNHFTILILKSTIN